MSIRLLEPAQAELDEAIAWYAEQAPGLGDAFLIEALKAIRLIDQFTSAWHPLTPQQPARQLSRSGVTPGLGRMSRARPLRVADYVPSLQ